MKFFKNKLKIYKPKKPVIFMSKPMNFWSLLSEVRKESRFLNIMDDREHVVMEIVVMNGGAYRIDAHHQCYIFYVFARYRMYWKLFKYMKKNKLKYLSCWYYSQGIKIYRRAYLSFWKTLFFIS